MNRIRFLACVCVTLIGFFVAETSAANNCPLIRNRFFDRFETLQENTQNRFGEKVSNSENFPVWITPNRNSKNEIVYLLHGFLGTPYEMQSTAEAFRKKGYTVIRDILPGHGVSADAANEFSHEELKKHIFGNLNALKNCELRVHLIGFSTGATLLHHYLQTQAHQHIASLSLISPYYRPSLWYGDLISNAARLLISSISIELTYTVTRFPDIKVAYLDPDHYVHDIPIHLANEVNALGAMTLLTTAKIDTPVFLLTTTNDHIAAPAITHVKIAADFSNIEIMPFGPWSFAPHHLMAESVSPVADQVHNAVFDFVSHHTRK